MKGILGRKVGMTEVFTTDGKLIPVTVVEVQPNVVTQIKTKETDGYEAIQLGAFDKKEKSSNNPEKGHAKKANTSPKRFLKEIRGVDTASYTLGQVIEAYKPETEVFAKMMELSYDILVNHPINIERKKKGLNPANCCWFWGAGTKPAVPAEDEPAPTKLE